MIYTCAMDLSFAVYLMVLLFFFVLVSALIHILHQIKEARLYGKDISQKNKVYGLVAKFFLKDLPK